MTVDLMAPHHELAFERLTKAQEYVSRGRYFQELDLADLEREVVKAARKLILEGDNEDNSAAVYDALVEYDLRGIERPFEHIAQEMEIMAYRNAARVAAMTYDERRKLDERVKQRYEAACWQEQ